MMVNLADVIYGLRNGPRQAQALKPPLTTARRTLVALTLSRHAGLDFCRLWMGLA
jgi:hypothetical protein